MDTIGTMHPVGKTELGAVEGGYDAGCGFIVPGIGPSDPHPLRVPRPALA